MTKQRSLRAMALAGICLAPLAVHAQDFELGGAATTPEATTAKEYDNEIDVGARYQSSTSPVFGRYTGHDSKGFGSLGGFHLEGGDAPDSGRTLRFEATGTGLDFQSDHRGPNNALAPESEIDVSIGQQGTWKANAYYDAITYTGENFSSPYFATGGLASGLLPYGGSTTTAAGTRTTAYYATHALPMNQLTAGTRRDIGGIDGKYILGNWTFSSDFRREHKEGTVLQTMYGVTGGIAFPEPVNYDTDRYDVKAAFATRVAQAQIGYTYTKFTDNNWAFNAPYFTPGAATTAFQLTQQYLLPTSSDAHYITAMGGYNLNPTTRIAGNFRFGIEASDQALGNSTATPGSTLAPAFNYAYLLRNPGSSDLLARTYNGNVQFTSRPLANLDVLASYTLDGRDMGSSPRSIYEAGHAEAAAATTASVIQGQSWTKQKAQLEAGYRVLPSTKVTVGYTYDDVHRDAGDAVGGQDAVGYWVGHSTENTLSAKVATSPISTVHASLGYEHAVRAGTYEYSVEPESGAFYQTPRTADRIKLRADYMPADQWTLGLQGKFETNHYHYLEEQTGTNRDRNASIGPDLTYTPNHALSLHGFYTYQEVFYDNRGNGPVDLNGGYGWDANTTDSIHTAGASADWKVTDRLKLGTEYDFSYGDIGYNLYNGLSSCGSYRNAAGTLVSLNPCPYGNVQNLPGVASSMHSVKVHGEYKLTENMSVMAGYGFDLFKDNDWQYGWSPVMMANGAVNTLTSGETKPSYRVHSLYTSVRLKF